MARFAEIVGDVHTDKLYIWYDKPSETLTLTISDGTTFEELTMDVNKEELKNTIRMLETEGEE